MTNDYYANIHRTSEYFEDLTSIDRIDANQVTSISHNEEINNNAINYSETSSTIYPISNIITQERSSNDNSNEISFNPQEWYITDSISGNFRAVRQYEFLLVLLENVRYSLYISWSDKTQGLFKIHEPERVATLWSQVKKRQTTGIMNYQKFSRAIRFYYQTGLMIKTHKKHIFRFQLPIKSIL